MLLIAGALRLSADIWKFPANDGTAGEAADVVAAVLIRDEEAPENRGRDEMFMKGALLFDSLKAGALLGTGLALFEDGKTFAENRPNDEEAGGRTGLLLLGCALTIEGMKEGTCWGVGVAASKVPPELKAAPLNIDDGEEVANIDWDKKEEEEEVEEEQVEVE